MSGLGLKVKGQLDLWCLYKTSVSIGSTFFASIMISLKQLYRKMNISRFFQYKCILGIKFGLAVKMIKVNPDSKFVQTW